MLNPCAASPRASRDSRQATRYRDPDNHQASGVFAVLDQQIRLARQNVRASAGTYPSRATNNRFRTSDAKKSTMGTLMITAPPGLTKSICAWQIAGRRG